MNRYKLLTVTHKSVPLSQLGQFYVARKPELDSSLTDGSGESPGDLSRDSDRLKWQRLEELKDAFALEELFYLETCNRVIYFFTSEEEIDRTFLSRFFGHVNPVLGETDPEALEEHVSTYQGHASLRHLFEVATSLDSLVIGEREILGQLRAAYEACWEKGLIGDMLRVAFKFAIPAAKQVYTETRIAQKPVSVVSLAARRLRDSNIPRDARIAVIGAGQTMQLMGKFLKGFGFEHFTVFNRSLGRAEKLAAELGGDARLLADLGNPRTEDAGFDVFVTCTGAPGAIIDHEIWSAWDNLPRQLLRPFVVDLAVPADVDQRLISEHEMHYIDLEELRGLAEKNLEFRREEVARAREIVEERVKHFATVFQQRQMERVFSSLPAEMRAMRTRAVDSVFREEVEAMDEESRATMERVLDYLEKKFVGLPMAKAREAASLHRKAHQHHAQH